MAENIETTELQFRPLTNDNWPDLEKLFGVRGACGGCWCMWWRIPRSQFNAQKGEANKLAFKTIVAEGNVPGILAYAGDEPIGWCSVAPREDFPVLEKSRTMKRLDDKPVWSIVCLFISRSWRRRGVSVALIKAAVAYVKEQGGQLVEAYPVVPRQNQMPDAFAWTGVAPAYEKAGFSEARRTSETKAIMRFEIKEGLQSETDSIERGSSLN